MLYPEPLSLRFDPASLSTLRANALDQFGVALLEDEICRTTGHIVALAPDGQRILSLHPDTVERRSQIRLQKKSQATVDAAVISEKLTIEGQRFSRLELEGARFLLTCVGVDDTGSEADAPLARRAFATHVAARHRAQAPARDARNLAKDILSTQALAKIGDHAEKSSWSADVLAHLSQDISARIAALDVVECHGDCHEGNFVQGRNGSGGLLPSHFCGAYPRGYDVATALWALLQTSSVSNTRAFCALLGQQVPIEKAVSAALTDLIVLRCLWWLGLRVSWRDHVPFETPSLIERHLEFALNVRVLQHEMQTALSPTHSGQAHER